jgi:hypothetical protein
VTRLLGGNVTLWTSLAADAVGIVLLAYAIYFCRYYRRDLLLAYVALNIGVFAVTALLVNAAVGAGLGLGLFGILSIIRLRSDSITQEEVAYYFVALGMGLVNGLHPGPAWTAPALTAVLVLVMWIVDHPALTAHVHRQTITLDRAYTDRNELVAVVQLMLTAEVRHLVVCETDLVRDITIIDVRYRSSGQSRDRSIAKLRSLGSKRVA